MKHKLYHLRKEKKREYDLTTKKKPIVENDFYKTWQEKQNIKADRYKTKSPKLKL